MYLNEPVFFEDLLITIDWLTTDHDLFRRHDPIDFPQVGNPVLHIKQVGCVLHIRQMGNLLNIIQVGISLLIRKLLSVSIEPPHETGGVNLHF